MLRSFQRLPPLDVGTSAREMGMFCVAFRPRSRSRWEMQRVCKSILRRRGDDTFSCSSRCSLAWISLPRSSVVSASQFFWPPGFGRASNSPGPEVRYGAAAWTPATVALLRASRACTCIAAVRLFVLAVRNLASNPLRHYCGGVYF